MNKLGDSLLGLGEWEVFAQVAVMEATSSAPTLSGEGNTCVWWRSDRYRVVIRCERRRTSSHLIT